MKSVVDFLPAVRHQRHGMPKLLKITSLIFLCNNLRKKWGIKMVFCMQLIMNVSYKLMLWFLMRMVKHSQSSQSSKFPMSLQYLKKEVRYEVAFWMQIHVKVSCKFVSTFWASKLPTRWYYWWAWSSILEVIKVTSLQYLYNISKKKLGMELQVGIIVFDGSGHIFSKYTR